METKEKLMFEGRWTDALQTYVRPYWDALLLGDLMTKAATGKLALSEMRGWMLQMYPVIHVFPKFLAESLIKVEDDYSRNFFINNIRIERAHARHWLSMADGFGVSEQELIAFAGGEKPVLRDVQSLTDWLWYINCKGTLAEAVAATSFAIEGAIGDVCRKVIHGFEYYEGREGVRLDDKTYRWFREHAHYDDGHARVALEIVERYAATDRVRNRTMLAAKRSLQLLHQALITATYAYSHKTTTKENIDREYRREERRSLVASIDFPDRRFRERRGAAMAVVA